MPRTQFDNELQRLQDEILALGSVVQVNLIRAVEALAARDKRAAQELIAADREVNAKRIQIGLDCFRLIATQQPIARDMRLLASTLEIVGELERIHDYVKGIARNALIVDDHPLRLDVTAELDAMARQSAYMLSQALAAFARRDAVQARVVPAQDDEVDALFNKVYAAIVDFVRHTPDSVDYANKLEWVAHNLERSADRVINICEWVIYAATGVYQEFSSEFEAPPPQHEGA